MCVNIFLMWEYFWACINRLVCYEVRARARVCVCVWGGGGGGGQICTVTQFYSSWHHQMETFSALMALYAGNSPVTGEIPSQRTVTRSFDGFLDLCLNKRLSIKSWRRWIEMQSRSLWCHCNVLGLLHHPNKCSHGATLNQYSKSFRPRAS